MSLDHFESFNVLFQRHNISTVICDISVGTGGGVATGRTDIISSDNHSSSNQSLASFASLISCLEFVL